MSKLVGIWLTVEELSLNDMQSLWDQFLDMWPLERVAQMSLEEYTAIQDKTTFTYWVETQTQPLANIKGSPSTKFGIYKRDPSKEAKEQTGLLHGEEYTWRVRFGTDEETAFASVREQVVNVIKAAKVGDLDTIDKLSLAPVYKWKIAFLYQEQASPRIVNIFAKDKLAELTSLPKTSSYPTFYRALMPAYRPQTFVNIAEYGRALWKQLDQESDLTEDGERQVEQYKDTGISQMDVNQSPLNQILYGPPGTGKTYHTIEAAVKAAEPTFIWESREKLKQEYDRLVMDKRIRFVTFHQSYGYEEFVEGLSATTTENGQIKYSIKHGVFKTIANDAQNNAQPETESLKKQNYVLVIDEVNRGNISKIFGELITLIEPSKRMGEEESLALTLPYSGEVFSVPNNLYIIGTMNTADRSLAMMDTALRRRFDFIEMMSKPELLAGIKVKGIALQHLLETLNQRIEILYDREHTLGHAFLMPVKVLVELGDQEKAFAMLVSVFQNKIIPLLEEYFFEDWEKIRLVLADNQKTEALQFVKREDQSKQTLDALFGLKHNLDQYGQSVVTYTLAKETDEVWQQTDAYIGIYQRVNKVPATQDNFVATNGDAGSEQ